MHMDNEIVRYEADPKEGLNSQQVDERFEQKLNNITKQVVGKTYFEIVKDNVLNFFNILLFVLAILLIIAKKYDSLLFLVVLIPNIAIGLYEDIHARRLMDKLRIVTTPRINVIRNGIKSEIKGEDLVLDDIAELSAGMQICADSVIVSGSILVNESLLTGESLSISKQVGDEIYSGSFVVSGNALVRVMKVGSDSYVEKLQSSAKKFKRSASEILKSLRILFRYIGIVVIVLGVSMVLIFGIQRAFSSYAAFQESMGPISGSMVSMIPSGLYLLTSVALATAVINLSKHQARVQDFYSVEMLARTNVLCVDKTGTITDGTMKLYKVVPFNSLSEVTVSGIVGDYANLSTDTNDTINALKKYFNYQSHSQAKQILNFNSDNKYSAITFASGTTYVLGAADCLNLNNKIGVMNRVNEFASRGYRVLVIAKAIGGIKDEKIVGACDALGLIVLQDNIKPDAIKTFEWFKNNNVSIRVISGDDAITVSEVARQAGVENYDKYISLAGMSLEEVKAIATQYYVFGRVTPEQKEVIVTTLKEAGNTVAMTGDGVNDILALKRADCSIAMASGSEAAKNVSHIVLLDSNFDHLPDVVAQGRRVINNLQRTCSLFLAKTIFAVVLTLIAIVMGIFNKEIKYPFLTNHLYIWEFASIGFASFFLALEPNAERLKGKFLGNVFQKAIPAGITSIIAVIAVFGMYHLNKYGICYTAINSREAAICMSAIIFTIVAIFTLLKICLPFSKYRAFVFGISASISVLGLGLAALLSYTIGEKKSLFHLDFTSLNPMNYFEVAIVLAILVTIYLAITYIIEVTKGEHLYADNKSRSKKSLRRK